MMYESTANNEKKLSNLFYNKPHLFQIIIEHYYGNFSYHSKQRLTTFNFFIVSLSFFCTAYAMLIKNAWVLTANDPNDSKYKLMASFVAFISYVLVIMFRGLDCRNETIININEKPLKNIQELFSKEFGDKEWKTFKLSDDKSGILATYGTVMPFIYGSAALLTGSGCVAGIVMSGITCYYCQITIAAILIILYLFVEWLHNFGVRRTATD